MGMEGVVVAGVVVVVVVGMGYWLMMEGRLDEDGPSQG